MWCVCVCACIYTMCIISQAKGVTVHAYVCMCVCMYACNVNHIASRGHAIACVLCTFVHTYTYMYAIGITSQEEDMPLRFCVSMQR